VRDAGVLAKGRMFDMPAVKDMSLSTNYVVFTFELNLAHNAACDKQAGQK